MGYGLFLPQRVGASPNESGETPNPVVQRLRMRQKLGPWTGGSLKSLPPQSLL